MLSMLSLLSLGRPGHAESISFVPEQLGRLGAVHARLHAHGDRGAV